MCFHRRSSFSPSFASGIDFFWFNVFSVQCASDSSENVFDRLHFTCFRHSFLFFFLKFCSNVFRDRLRFLQFLMI